jgi:hypothetical protein
VLQSVEHGAWLVSVGAKTLMVRADVPLEPGQRVWVPALAPAPPPAHVAGPAQPAAAPVDPVRAEALPVLLAALASTRAAGSQEPPGAAAARAVAALDAHGESVDLPVQILAAIRALLRPAAQPADPHGTADVLRRAVEDAGTFFEARTARLLRSPAGSRNVPAADLRSLVGSALARLFADTAPMAGAQPARLATAEALRAALANAGLASLSTPIETAAHDEAHGIWRVEVPLQLGDRHVRLDCEFAPDRGGDGRGGSASVGQLHVLVTPDGTPPLEARFAWRGRDALAVDVYVETGVRAAALASDREALEARLRAAGFARASVDVWINPARLARWATRRPAASAAGSVLDTHA